MKYFFLILAFLIVVTVALLGWRGHTFTKPPLEIFSDMVRQPKVKAEVPSGFFADGRGSRVPVPGTVPLGYEMPFDRAGSNLSKTPEFSTGSSYRDTGMIDGQWGRDFPSPVSMKTMERGRERYGIYCATCHGATGSGNGMANKFGLATVQSLLQERIRVMPVGEIYHTITKGKNTMMGYGDRIMVDDRWAIIAYLRALQKSQGGASLSEIPPEEQTRLEHP